MPGRGQYWKKGGLVDETVKEEDLSQALQTKVNSGGGVVELLKTITVGSDTAGITTITLDSPVNFADYAEFELIVQGLGKVQANSVGVIMNGDENSTYSFQGDRNDDIGLGNVHVNNSSSPNWELFDGGSVLGIGQQFSIKLTLAGAGGLLDANKVLLGQASISYGNAGGNHASSVGNIRQTQVIATTLSSFGIKMGGTMELGVGTVITVFGKKIV